YSHLPFKIPIPIQVNCRDIQESQVTESCRKRKLHVAQDIDDGKDVISSLPNCVLSHILSFLPTKDAVGSCILSRRWQDLWTGLPNIDFDDRQVYCRSMNLSEKPISFFDLAPFHNFVERVLIHRDVTYITRFRLSCRVWCETRVSSWISSAIRRNVKELELFLELHNPFHLPPRVFNCSSLRTLKICMECTLKLPNNVFLPNLRTLYLGAVGFSDEESVNKLFSGCPALEELKLIDCSWEKLESITISIPSLKSLRIDELFYMLSVNKRNDCIIKLELPNLVSFEFLGGLFNGIVIENQLSQLTHATVFILERPWCNFNTTLPPDVFNLFTRLKHATVLRVSSSTIKTLFVAEGFLGQLPLFQKLTRLELNVCIEDVSPEVLLKFLVGFPCLEILVFHEGAVSDQLELQHDVCSIISQPSCYLPKLKMVNLCFIHGGSVGQMYVLKNVVDIAPALQKVSIFCCSKMGSIEKDEIARKVQMLLDVCKGNFTVLFS
ncbi:F-box/LRR-repeat protein At4g14103-like, partial [Silene latifolia]|uniref:F-box/LRR-repeat protein At4g14103-like n=1 Tax=Silene latifolia TaxID=37657 RepID=UPI003D776035